MKTHWNKASESLSDIKVISNPKNQPVTIQGNSDELRCVGIGTDAAVFQSILAPTYAFKVYAEDRLHKIKAEEEVYQLIGDSAFFSTCFGAAENFLVLSYEEGTTLYDCLLQGIHIPKQVILDVEEAREYVRKQGLNPRDIHLKNILLQEGRAKILDVSEYIQSGNDYRWEHLMKAYDDYYHMIDGKSVPVWVLETIRKWYNNWKKYYDSYEEFVQFVLKNTPFSK